MIPMRETGDATHDSFPSRLRTNLQTHYESEMFSVVHKGPIYFLSFSLDLEANSRSGKRLHDFTLVPNQNAAGSRRFRISKYIGFADSNCR
jgi:hypothetical protein